MKKIAIIFFPIFLTLAIIGCKNDKSFVTSSSNSLSLTNLPPLKFAQPSEPLPNKNFPYELNTDISFSGRFNVYRLMDKKINKKQFIELANKFEVFPLEDSVTYSRDTSMYSYKNEAVSVSAQQKGIFSYSLKKSGMEGVRDKSAQLTDKDAEKVAKDYLSKLDLLPDGSFIASIDTNSPAGDKTVTFNVKANDKPISGVAKIEVCIGNDSKVETVTSNYKDYILIGKKDLRDVQVALDDLKNNKGYECFKSGVTPVKCCISKVELCYYEGSDPENQPYLYPIYKMMGYTLDDKGNKYDYVGYVQAIE